MAQGVVLTFDPKADDQIRDLWAKLDAAGLPTERKFPPHLTLAMATDIPARTRAALKSDLRMLAVPNIGLEALSTFSSTENVLMLAAVTDGELLAVHSAVHDVLAGRVRNPSAYYLPGAWMAHCTLVHGITRQHLVEGFDALFPVAPIRVRARQIAVLDTTNDEIDVLVDL